MAKVYGYSDDIVCIEHVDGGCTEVDCYRHDVLLTFEDGTIIRAGYPKKDKGVWWIEIEKQGTAYHSLEVCEDEDAEVYSDVFYIDAELSEYSVVPRKSDGGAENA